MFVRNVTGIAGQRGFRLYWAESDQSSGIIGVDGECSAQVFRTAAGCAHSGLRRFNEWPRLLLDRGGSRAIRR